MNQGILIAIIAGLIIFFLLFMVMRSSTTKGKERIPNYRAMFILGVIWLPLGIATQNPGFWGMGIVFAIAGAANKDKWGKETKWSELPPQTRRLKIIFTIGLTVFLLAAIIYYMLSR